MRAWYIFYEHVVYFRRFDLDKNLLDYRGYFCWMGINLLYFLFIGSVFNPLFLSIFKNIK